MFYWCISGPPYKFKLKYRVFHLNWKWFLNIKEIWFHWNSACRTWPLGLMVDQSSPNLPLNSKHLHSPSHATKSQPRQIYDFWRSARVHVSKRWSNECLGRTAVDVGSLNIKNSSLTFENWQCKVGISQFKETISGTKKL